MDSLENFSLYVNVYDKIKILSSTCNRDIYKQKISDRDEYTVEKVKKYLEGDPDMKNSDIALALGGTHFLLYAAFKGCCNVNWKQLFALPPKTYSKYIDCAFEKVSNKFPNILDKYNNLGKNMTPSSAKDKNEEMIR